MVGNLYTLIYHEMIRKNPCNLMLYVVQKRGLTVR